MGYGSFLKGGWFIERLFEWKLKNAIDESVLHGAVSTEEAFEVLRGERLCKCGCPVHPNGEGQFVADWQGDTLLVSIVESFIVCKLCA